MADYDLSLFLAQARRSHGTVGAVAPSGRALSRLMAAAVPTGGPAPRRVLEVGAGTGAVTRRLVRRLTSADTLVVVEVNAAFCTLLRTRIAVWASGPCAPRVEIVEGDVLAYAPAHPFDHVVSSLPFNAFPEPLAGRLTAALRGAVGAGGTLTFFEYVGLRALRRWTDRALGRSGRLAVEADLLPHVVASRHALWNVPPATVHTVRFAQAPSTSSRRHDPPDVRAHHRQDGLAPLPDPCWGDLCLQNMATRADP